MKRKKMDEMEDISLLVNQKVHKVSKLTVKSIFLFQLNIKIKIRLN